MRPDAVCWREWDDEFVLFNDETGNTHHLSALGGEVLLTLLRYPLGVDSDALIAEVATRVEAPDNVDLAAEIERALHQLAELRLAVDRSA